MRIGPLFALGLLLAPLTIGGTQPVDAVPEGQITWASQVTVVPGWFDPGEASVGSASMFARILRCGAVAVAGGFLLLLWAAGLGAQAAEIKVMATVAFTPTLTELGPKFEAATGNKLVIVYSVIADLKKRIEAGETADVMILSRTALDDLQTQGKVASASIVNLGKSYVAVGVRAGAPKPDISTPDNLMTASRLPFLAAPGVARATMEGGACREWIQCRQRACQGAPRRFARRVRARESIGLRGPYA